jgi:hypothetical protein
MSRELQPSEVAMLHKLLEKPFQGRDELMAQVPGALVDDLGDPTTHYALAFTVKSSERAPPQMLMPVSAEIKDDDGTPIHVILHTREGFLYTLEIVKLNGTPIIKPLAVDELHVVVTENK